MRYGFEVLDSQSNTASLSEWDRLVETSPGGTLYHSSAWLKALSEGMGFDVRLHILCESERPIVGVVLRRVGRYGLSVAHRPWETVYNGLVCADDCPHEAIIELRDHLLSEYSHVRLVQSPYSTVSIPHDGRWTARCNQTPVLDLRDLDRLWNSFDRRVRQRVRKAETLGVRVKTHEDFAVFFDLYRETYRRQSLPMPLKSEQVVKCLELGARARLLQLQTAYTRDGKAAAALVVGKDSKRAYFMFAASHPEHRKSDAMTLMWWKAIRQLSLTRPELDLVGLATPGISRFKKSFSPRMLEYHELNGFANTTAGFAMGFAVKGYHVLKRLT